jgi:hypothetical protein
LIDSGCFVIWAVSGGVVAHLRDLLGQHVRVSWVKTEIEMSHVRVPVIARRVGMFVFWFQLCLTIPFDTIIDDIRRHLQILLLVQVSVNHDNHIPSTAYVVVYGTLNLP